MSEFRITMVSQLRDRANQLGDEARSALRQADLMHEHAMARSHEAEKAHEDAAEAEEMLDSLYKLMYAANVSKHWAEPEPDGIDGDFSNLVVALGNSDNPVYRAAANSITVMYSND